MNERRKTKKINIGAVEIGGDAPISVQSMCNTDTRNVSATLEQIGELATAGCEIVRLAVLNKDAANPGSYANVYELASAAEDYIQYTVIKYLQKLILVKF